MIRVDAEVKIISTLSNMFTRMPMNISCKLARHDSENIARQDGHEICLMLSCRSPESVVANSEYDTSSAATRTQSLNNM